MKRTSKPFAGTYLVGAAEGCDVFFLTRRLAAFGSPYSIELAQIIMSSYLVTGSSPLFLIASAAASELKYSSSCLACSG